MNLQAQHCNNFTQHTLDSHGQPVTKNTNSSQNCFLPQLKDLSSEIKGSCLLYFFIT